MNCPKHWLLRYFLWFPSVFEVKTGKTTGHQKSTNKIDEPIWIKTSHHSTNVGRVPHDSLQAWCEAENCHVDICPMVWCNKLVSERFRHRSQTTRLTSKYTCEIKNLSVWITLPRRAIFRNVGYNKHTSLIVQHIRRQIRSTYKDKNVTNSGTNKLQINKKYTRKNVQHNTPVIPHYMFRHKNNA